MQPQDAHFGVEKQHEETLVVLESRTSFSPQSCEFLPSDKSWKIKRKTNLVTGSREKDPKCAKKPNII
jgi:hypothetical protein